MAKKKQKPTREDKDIAAVIKDMMSSPSFRAISPEGQDKVIDAAINSMKAGVPFEWQAGPDKSIEYRSRTGYDPSTGVQTIQDPEGGLLMEYTDPNTGVSYTHNAATGESYTMPAPATAVAQAPVQAPAPAPATVPISAAPRQAPVARQVPTQLHQMTLERAMPRPPAPPQNTVSIPPAMLSQQQQDINRMMAEHYRLLAEEEEMNKSITGL